MIRLYSDKRAREVIDSYGTWIATVSGRYGVPAAVIKAMLFQEMTLIDAMDPLADIAVSMGLAGKKDSSTGYAQIFGYVGLKAANYAVDRGLATYDSLGISCDHRLDASNSDDVRLVWKLLNANPKANIEIATINLLVAAEEMVGRTDFENFDADQLKLVFTRYNANTHQVTPYGEQAYRHYESYCAGRPPEMGHEIQA